MARALNGSRTLARSGGLAGVVFLLILVAAPDVQAKKAKGPATGPEAAAKLKSQGDEAKAGGDMKGAAKFYKGAVEADPTNVATVEDYGRVLFALGNFKDAVALFQKVSAADDPAAFWNLGYALRKTGDYKGAAQAYVAFVKNVPGDPDGYYQLAECFRKLGQYADAAAAYNLYIEKETRASEQAWVEKARQKSAQMKSSAPAGAVTAAEAAAKPPPAAPEASAPVAAAAPGATPAPAAEVAIVVPMPTAAPPVQEAQVSARDPNAAVSKIREGDSLFKQQRFREALFAYQDAVKLDDQSTNALLKEGLAYANMSYFQEAVARWQHVLELDPKNAYAPKYIEKAKPHLGQATAADSSSPQPVQTSGLLTSAGSVATTEKPVTAEDAAAAKDFYRKAVPAMNSQQYDAAIALFNQAIERNPKYVNAFIGRAGANFGLKKYSEAIADYQIALQLNPSLATPIYGMGRAYDRIGDKLNACAQYRRYVGSAAVDAQPNLKKQAQDQLGSVCGG